MTTTPTCTCSVKQTVSRELSGAAHTECEPDRPAQLTSDPPALNSDALVNSITAALGTNTTTTTTL